MVRQALLGRPLLTTVVVCLVVDAALIALGVTGLGAAIAGRPWVAGVVPWAAVAFLLTYAARAWRTAATFSTESFADTGSQAVCRVSAAATAFAVSALNPQAYLDSAVIMGGLAAPLPFEASGAGRLSPRLCRPGSLRALDQTAAVFLLALAAALVWREMS